MVWKATFAARREAVRLYGDRYLLLRNDDLRSDPARELSRVYELLGRNVPKAVGTWARDAVREPEEVFAGSDPRWSELLDRLDLGDDLAAAGYDEPVTSSH